jgi:hypothetical protein
MDANAPATGGEPLYKVVVLSARSRRLPEAPQDSPSLLIFTYLREIRSKRQVETRTLGNSREPLAAVR